MSLTTLWRAMLAGRSALVLVLLLACTVLAGCGSSSRSGSATTTASEGDVSGNLKKLPEGAPANGTLPSVPTSPTRANQRAYLAAVFADAQRFWTREFRRARTPYKPARLALFSRVVHSGCGAQENTGPFYCPANRTIYLDLTFFDAIARRAGVGPFAQAYIIGHELGHHVQSLTSVIGRIHALDEQDPAGANRRSVRVELQADCLAGAWAHSSQARGQLSVDDLDDALRTAAFIGDDFQQHAAGRIVDSALWTHGSSGQRQHWLAVGFNSGRPASCDTFANPVP